MITLLLHIVEFFFWVLLASSVVYIVFFALVSLFQKKNKPTEIESKNQLSNFLVFIPAYHEDIVIRQSVEAFLKQDYPKEHYRLIVISDNMSADTNNWLSSQPLTLLQPTFDKSSKAKALQYAIQETERLGLNTSDCSTRAVILDADNIVLPDFLTRLNKVCQQGYQAIQCHRTAKNSDNDIAALDGISEEINNTLFRRAHNIIGLSSALIGSGMCFDYIWFASHVINLSTAVEDRELETLLLRERIYIHYVEDIFVMDEKVSSKDNFQRQRLRWMTGQVQSLFSMLPYIPKAIITGNIDYIDKTIQQALIPRSILLLLLPLFACLITLLHWPWSLKWWGLLFLFALSLFIAIPSQLRTRSLLSKIISLPSLAWRMTKNLFHIDKSDTTFHHTDHNK